MYDDLSAIQRVLDEARKKLLDTGTRNRLVHVNRENQRANALNIVNEVSDEVFKQLRHQGRKMQFMALGRDKDGDDDDLFDDLDPAEDVTPDRQTDQFLETPLGPKALAKRLLRLSTDARVAEQEQGLNILYLALGFLTWREDRNSQVERQAPLILLPVELVRNERTSRYDIRARDEEISTNLPIAARLMQDFGIRLPEIPEGEEWLPSEYFDAVADVIDGKPGWTIDPDGMQLGFYSFAKLLMHRDLDPENWPDNALTGTELMGGLLGDGLEGTEPLFGPEDKLDVLLDPAEIIQVVDADASQTKVIEEVRKGRSLVVQGPPGTGKSQTITNLIAAAVHDGKSVLFVAEKMAALSVVHQRLVKVGLRDISLEIHSRQANKKALAQELGRTLNANLASPASSSSADRLRKVRNQLNGIALSLHDPIGDGLDSPFNAMTRLAKFIGNGTPTPRVPLDGLGTLSREDRAGAIAGLNRFIAAMDRVGDAKAHPFADVTELDLQPPDLARLDQEVASALETFEAFLKILEPLAQLLGRANVQTLGDVSDLADGVRALSQPPKGLLPLLAQVFERLDNDRLFEALEAGDAWAEAKAGLADKVTEAAWEIETSRLRAAFVRGENSFFARFGGDYRRASSELAGVLSGQLPKQAAERRALIDAVADVQTKRRALADDEGYLGSALGEFWRGERTDFSGLKSKSEWARAAQARAKLASSEVWRQALETIPDPEAMAQALEARRDRLRSALEAVHRRLALDLTAVGASAPHAIDKANLSDLQNRLKSMLGQTARYDEWSELKRATNTASERGASSVVQIVLEGNLTASEAIVEFEYACAEASWKHALDARPELKELSHLDRHELVELFRGLDKARFEENRDEILSRHYAQIPKGSAGEIGIIRGEIARKRGHKPIRWVMQRAGSMVQRIKPVFLMSPLSVAQFLPPGVVKFDLLIIDEASQVRPEDALGVIARARQIVVVGDEKQLPPTSFFDRMAGDADTDDEEEALGATAADMESILTLCAAKGVSSRMLEWHYRSRDPSLIRVSNAEFYGDNLVLPPSPLELDDNYGLKFNQVPGVYSSASKGGGRAGTNKVEAQQVVKAAARHAREWPKLSLGIVTFSKAQADMMTEVLDHARRSDPVLDAFLREGQNEDVFVKNIENVQGDERDVILISVGYGPHEPGGRLASMNFGPVNGEGGERRLNVLFSRARVRCEVFASFAPGDMDLSRTTKEGPRVLKRFLEFASSGRLDQPRLTGLDPDSPFEEDVASELVRMGYTVDPQVGSAGFRVDLAVRNPDRPGQYLLAVECDGATYHSALWARERDRLRQDVLEGLGWTFHRIWSTDWFHRREQEKSRLAEALEQARRRAADGIPVSGANHERPMAEEEVEEAPEVFDIPVQLRLDVPTYVCADLTANTANEPHETPISTLSKLVAKIVEIEGPIHADEVARRVASAFGKQRTGNRIKEAAGRALQYALRTDKAPLKYEGRFWMTEKQAAKMPVRSRSGVAGAPLKAAYLPPMEIRAAGDLVIQENGELELAEKVKAVSQLFGFQRVGPELQEQISQALDAH